MFNIAVGVLAFLYWYITGDLWPAVLGVILALIIWDVLWFVTIALSAAIIGLCAWYFWGEIVPSLVDNPVLREMAVSCIYMGVVFVKAALSFK
ncbi:hypothetical protein BOW47_04285 [Solemya velum gill symbiont]|uniref:hypothetical protein n=1 Tax=Solemya velum gill symbiont TaxID=2340 RepID=UPI000997638B|nr:hypothetical protein [Solemya velum gill symbiont]OOZ69398.1 hypothetical protein BOW47_04285 [Solemya velum gill symbiont]